VQSLGLENVERQGFSLAAPPPRTLLAYRLSLELRLKASYRQRQRTRHEEQCVQSCTKSFSPSLPRLPAVLPTCPPDASLQTFSGVRLLDLVLTHRESVVDRSGAGDFREMCVSSPLVPLRRVLLALARDASLCFLPGSAVLPAAAAIL
jgi:hypothetical protein